MPWLRPRRDRNSWLTSGPLVLTGTLTLTLPDHTAERDPSLSCLYSRMLRAGAVTARTVVTCTVVALMSADYGSGFKASKAHYKHLTLLIFLFLLYFPSDTDSTQILPHLPLSGLGTPFGLLHSSFFPCDCFAIF